MRGYTISYDEPIEYKLEIRELEVTENMENIAVAVKEKVEKKPVEIKQVDVFDEIEKIILEKNPRPIRLERMQKDRPTDEGLENFLIKFFTKWNENRNTIFVPEEGATNRERQTEMGKRRSLADIFLICKYYYPKATLREVLDLLYIKLRKSMPDGFRTSHCYTIQKRVWYFDEDRETEQLNTDETDEFGNKFNYYTKNLKIK